MSISISSYRRQSNELGIGDLLNAREVSVGHAIVSAITYELGFGGRVVAGGPENKKVTIKTRVLSKEDTTVFVASSTEEHLALLTAVSLFYQVMKEKGFCDDTLLTKFYPKIDTQGIRPMDAVHFFPVLAGQSRAAVTYILLLAEGDENLAKSFAKSTLQDLESLIQLKYEGTSTEDLVQLI